MINVMEPLIGKKEKEYILNALKKNEISTYGEFTNIFVKKVKKINKSKFNVALTSGSVALYLANKICGASNDSMVLAPSYTFVATISSIVHCGAAPRLFDISEKNLCISEVQISNFLKNNTYKKKKNYYSKETNQRIVSIIIVLTFSLKPDLAKIKKLAKKYNLKIIIDAACAFGTKFRNQPLTKFADIVVYSFNGNKSFTSGGGGILSTDKKYIFEKASVLANNGKSKKMYNYKTFGHNFKMTNLHAAIGIGQLENYENIKKNKNKLQSMYRNKIKNKNFVYLSKYLDINHMLWLNFILTKNYTQTKKIIKYLYQKKIKTGVFWKPIHLQNFAKKITKEKMTNTNFIWKRILPLPSSLNLNKLSQEYIVKILNKFPNDK